MARWGLMLGLGAVLLAHPVYAAEPDAPEELISRTDAIHYSLQEKLANKARELGADKAEQIALSTYYSSRPGFLWVTENGLTPRVGQLRKVLSQADEWGLSAGDYRLPDEAGLKRGAGLPAEWLAEAELRISLAALAYSKHAQAGRVEPTSLDEEFLDLRPARPDPLAVMKGIADAGDRLGGFLESFHPQNEQFRILKQKLAEMRGGRGPGRDAVKIPSGPQLKPGSTHPQVALLRQRLSVPASQDVMSDGPPEEYFDDSLAEAVRDFQTRSGLPNRGVVNAATRDALNRGVSTADASAILVNMERWRWEPRDLGSRYIFVNIPEFLVRVIDNGRLIHEERIVTGSPQHRTPVFSDEMEHIVFNPYWNVPESIMLKEILPAARRNPDFFARNRLEVVWQGRRTVDPYMVDWDAVNPTKVSLRQPPGPSNALGQIKFLFPNKHSVYMHDTPTKKLFNEQVRAFSHGCMRVRNPVRFAEILLAEDGWSPAKVRSAIETTEDYQVSLSRKVPVHIMYFTLWADRTGRLHEFADVYDYDDRLKVALKLQAPPKPRAKRQQNFDPGENGLGN